MSRQSTCGECGGTYSHMVDCPTYRRMTNTHEARQQDIESLRAEYADDTESFTGRRVHAVLADLAVARAQVGRMREALELVRDGRCSCGYRFKWTGMQMRCENCGTHCGSVPPYVREIAKAALAAAVPDPEEDGDA